MKQRIALLASTGLTFSARIFVKGFKWYYFSPKAPKELGKE